MNVLGITSDDEYTYSNGTECTCYDPSSYYPNPKCPIHGKAQGGD